MNKSRKTILIFIIGLIFFIPFYFIFPWMSLYIGISMSPNPPKPEITYGEFPFRLEYEIDGELTVIEDTVICEYDGIGMNEGVGKYRKWKNHLASTGDKNILLIADDKREIYCYVGDAEYYMNDEKYPEERPLTPRVFDVALDASDRDIFMSDEILTMYKIKIIDWKLSDPIINSFPEK